MSLHPTIKFGPQQGLPPYVGWADSSLGKDGKWYRGQFCWFYLVECVNVAVSEGELCSWDEGSADVGKVRQRSSNSRLPAGMALDVAAVGVHNRVCLLLP